MSIQQSSYRQIFKATSLFGGVQVFGILIGFVRVKFVAILLGATGVGLMGLLNAPLNMIIALTGMGIAISSVRNISDAYGSGDQSRVSSVVQTLRRWSWVTGLLGMLVTLILSPWLSLWSFGDYHYAWAYALLSCTLVIQSVSKGQGAVLQGTRMLNGMAQANVYGSILGLLLTLPLYYLYGLKGIVPAMLLTPLIGFSLTGYFSRRVVLEPVTQSYKETYRAGLGMAKLGVYMTLSGFMGTLTSYVLDAFIRKHGGVVQVGLYNAGWGIVVQYVGLVFTAMATDYYPRLASIHRDLSKMKELVKQQSETALYIMTPLLTLLIITMPWIVRLLYTSAFLPVITFTNLTVLGMPFKVVAWAIGYVYLAKGNGKLFFTLEFVSGLFFLGTNILGYYLLKLDGLGISFMLNYLVGGLFYYLMLKKKFDFSFPLSFLSTFLFTYLFCISSFLSTFIDNTIYRYSLGFIIFVFATTYSIYWLDKLMDLKAVFRSYKERIASKFRNN